MQPRIIFTYCPHIVLICILQVLLFEPLPVWQACGCVNTVQTPGQVPAQVCSGIWGGTTSLPLSHFLITGKGDEVGGGGGGGRAILMKMGHVIKVDLTRFIRSSGSRTVNTEIKWTVPLTAANTQDKIRLHRNCFYPTDGKWGRE